MSQPTVLVPAGPYTSDTVPNQKDWSPKSTANGIQDEVIRQVLQSMADLRRYILVEKPAAEVAQRIKDEKDRLQEKWKMDNMWRKKSDRELEPIHISAHAQTFTAAALAQHLQAHEKRGLAKMIVKDEVSFLFGKIKAANDERRQQVLECFDALGHTAEQKPRPDTSRVACFQKAFEDAWLYGAIDREVTAAIGLVWTSSSI